MLTFRVKKPLTWNGVTYQPGELVEIEEGHPRIRVLIEQSHHLEYANVVNTDEVKPLVIETYIG